LSSGVFKAWCQASRPQFYVATLIPLALGAVTAVNDNAWDPWRWLAVLVASFLVHLNGNLANDYFEYFSGADEGDSIGGSRVLQEGKITLRQIKYFMIGAYTISFFIGVWIIYVSGAYWLAAIMLFAFLSSIFYTARPIRYGYHGLGELFVGLNMGPVMVVGTYAALTGSFSLLPLMLSIPVALMVALILYYQSLPDIESDRAVGKYTLAVRLDRHGALWGYRAFIAATYIVIALLIILDYLDITAMVALMALPLAISVDRMIRTTADWVELHGRGGKVRLFYLLNGIIIVTVTYLY